MNTKKITHHIGIYGNSPGLTPVVCNSSNRVVAVISVLDYQPDITEDKVRICKLCRQLLLHGITNGLRKANKVNYLLHKIRYNNRMAQQQSRFSQLNWGRKAIDYYCDAAHKYEEELINLY